MRVLNIEAIKCDCIRFVTKYQRLDIIPEEYMQGSSYDFEITIQDQYDFVTYPVKLHIMTDNEVLEERNKAKIRVNNTSEFNTTANETTTVQNDTLDDAAVQAVWKNFLANFYGRLNGRKMTPSILKELEKLPFAVPYIGGIDNKGVVEIIFSKKVIVPPKEVLAEVMSEGFLYLELKNKDRA